VAIFHAPNPLNFLSVKLVSAQWSGTAKERRRGKERRSLYSSERAPPLITLLFSGKSLHRQRQNLCPVASEKEGFPRLLRIFKTLLRSLLTNARGLEVPEGTACIELLAGNCAFFALFYLLCHLIKDEHFFTKLSSLQWCQSTVRDRSDQLLTPLDRSGQLFCINTSLSFPCAGGERRAEFLSSLSSTSTSGPDGKAPSNSPPISICLSLLSPLLSCERGEREGKRSTPEE